MTSADGSVPATIFRYERTLHFIDRRGHISRLRAGVLPAPLHLTGSFLLAKFISWSDKVRIALGMWTMMREPSNPAGDSVEHWLRRHYQNDQTIERFWNVVLSVPSMNRLTKSTINTRGKFS